MMRFSLSPPSGLLASLTLPVLSQAAWLPLDSTQLINLSGRQPAHALVDEQPPSSLGTNLPALPPQTPFTGPWQNQQLYYPMPVVIDLKTTHQLNRIAYYDGEGSGQLDFDTLTDGTWKPLHQDTLQRYQAWVVQPVSGEARYLRLTFEHPNSKINELLLDAHPIADAEQPAPTVYRRTPALMDDFIGVNAFVDDPIERITAFGHLREYHQWQWDEGNGASDYQGFPEHEIAWSPSWVSGPGWGWDFDQFYTRLKEAGISVAPCVQGCAPYLADHAENTIDRKPVPTGADPTDPQTYRAHASFLFQFAARYGSRVVPDELLTLRSDQPRRSGLGLIHHLENWNEPDKWWAGRDAYFSPAELAAMCSADRDGHQGALGRNVGVRQADPTMKLVLGGLALPHIEYLRAMQFWADLHRKGDFPADVINLHHYSNDQGGQAGQPTTGISPEADALRERFEHIVDWMNRHLPDRELWVSEFGYDLNPRSVQRAPAIGATPPDEVQACWIIRSFLELAAAGVDRAQLYMLRDVNAGNTVKYNSSGVTAEKWSAHRPKRSWFYVSAFRRVLAGTRFTEMVDPARPEVRIYRFSSDDQQRDVYALWSPTTNNTLIDAFTWQLARPEPVKLSLMTLEPDSAQGHIQSLTADSRQVSLTVSERPCFVTAQY